MMIDADLNKNTGTQGIDYQMEISWNNKTTSWDLILYEHSSFGAFKILKNIKNITGFYQPDSNFVDLNLDLNDIQFPKQMDILFYAESTQNKSLITDFTKFVRVPPPYIDLSIPLIILKQGETKSTSININSTDLEPSVQVFFKNISKDLQIKYEYDFVNLPKHGFASIPLTVTANPDGSILPHTSFIYANVTFPEIKFLETPNNEYILPSIVERENKTIVSSFLVTVEEKLSLVEKTSLFWDQLGDPIVFFYGILVGISPFLFKKLRKIIKIKDY